MPTNPPTPADRLAAVKACYTPPSVEYTTSSGDRGTRTYYHGKWDDAALTALLAADPPGATVTVLCAKCSGTDILTRYCGAGEHRYGYMTCVAPFDDKRNEPHGTPLLHRHCRTCQWRWNDVPHDQSPITEE